METRAEHYSVMHAEVIEGLAINPSGVYVDGTYGRGGHARSILAQLAENGRLIVMDKDPQAIEAAREVMGNDSRVTILHDDFDSLADHLKRLSLTESIDGVLLDLGVSSPQIDDGQRGFSFQNNGPLDMRMDTSRGISAREWLAEADEKEISQVLWQLGEERHSRRIARRIVEYREENVIDDTASLVSIIRDAIPSSRKPEKKHPATRSFQAIRIFINQELEHVNRFLESLFDVLKVNGRLLVISFHSLEDRLIKRFYREWSTPTKIPKGLPLRDDQRVDSVRLKLIGKAIKAGVEELAENTRSRSAVLRIAERIV